MLHQPTLEKLEAMRLHGMAQAWREMAKSEQAFAELGFEERMALLVDRQYTWRQNEAFEARLRRAKLRANACVEDIDYRAARGLDKTLIRSLVAESAWVQRHENVFVCGPTGVGKSYLACALAQKACRDGYYRVSGDLRGGVVPRSGAGPGRRQLAKHAAAAQQNRRAGGGRLGDDAAERSGGQRLLGDLRGSLPGALVDSDFADAGSEVARTNRRRHRGRGNPRSYRSSRAPDRAERRFDAEEGPLRNCAGAMKPPGVPSNTEGKGLNCRPLPPAPFPASRRVTLRFAPDASRFSCHSDHSRAKSKCQRRFAPTSLIDYTRIVIGIRGEW